MNPKAGVPSVPSREEVEKAAAQLERARGANVSYIYREHANMLRSLFTDHARLSAEVERLTQHAAAIDACGSRNDAIASDIIHEQQQTIATLQAALKECEKDAELLKNTRMVLAELRSCAARDLRNPGNKLLDWQIDELTIFRRADTSLRELDSAIAAREPRSLSRSCRSTPAVR